MPSRPLLLGHRGARRHAPENTLAAFELALQHGCDGFELDVRCTAANELVCFHDPAAGELRVDNTTLAELISAANTEVPNIATVLEKFGHRAYINIELKVAGVERELVSLLKKYPAAKGLLISSFLPEAVESMHSIFPEADLGYICDRRNPLELWRSLPITHVVLHHSLLEKTLFEEIRRAGKKIYVWTLNSELEIRRFAEMGVDAIISDDTHLLGDVLRHP
jgi:glycerophosphoryl diester phosphodiesterase